MKIPKIVTEEIEYYIITVWWPDKYMGKTLDTAYKTARGAERKAEALMNSGEFKAVTIRKEEVWKRDEHNEFSSSGVYKNYGII